jgi:hypothetical protein
LHDVTSHQGGAYGGANGFGSVGDGGERERSGVGSGMLERRAVRKFVPDDSPLCRVEAANQAR